MSGFFYALKNLLLFIAKRSLEMAPDGGYKNSSSIFVIKISLT